jgi:Fur family peroxide stress response transcriptional regulator
MAELGFEDFRKICGKHGLRFTPQRWEIFHELAGDRTHPSAEEIHERVCKQMPSISLDTVYRTIYAFEECGLIRRVQSLEEPMRFDPDLRPHHHLICTRCRRIEDFSWLDLDTLEIPENVQDWGDIEIRQMNIRGRCKQCREEDSKGQS